MLNVYFIVTTGLHTIISMNFSPHLSYLFFQLMFVKVSMKINMEQNHIVST